MCATQTQAVNSLLLTYTVLMPWVLILLSLRVSSPATESVLPNIKLVQDLQNAYKNARTSEHPEDH